MEMLEIRHSLEIHLTKVGFTWHGGGVDLTTGDMDITFDDGERNYKILLTDEGAVSDPD